jgi:uncharacterized membrane protein
MKEMFQLVSKLISEIEDAVTSGVSEEEILKRLTKPGSAGQQLVSAIKKRKGKLDDFITNG